MQHLTLRCFDDDGTIGDAPTGRTTSAIAVENGGSIYGYVALTRDERGALAYRATITDPLTGVVTSAVSVDAVDAVGAVLRQLTAITEGVRLVAASIAFPFIR